MDTTSLVPTTAAQTPPHGDWLASQDLWGVVPELVAWSGHHATKARGSMYATPRSMYDTPPPTEVTLDDLERAEAKVRSAMRPVTAVEVIHHVARLSFHYPDRNLTPGMMKLVGEDFAMVFLSEAVTLTELHRACYKWLASDERFAPTPGALLAKARPKSLYFEAPEQSVLEAINRARNWIVRGHWRNEDMT